MGLQTHYILRRKGEKWSCALFKELTVHIPALLRSSHFSFCCFVVFFLTMVRRTKSEKKWDKASFLYEGVSMCIYMDNNTELDYVIIHSKRILCKTQLRQGFRKRKMESSNRSPELKHYLQESFYINLWN